MNYYKKRKISFYSILLTTLIGFTGIIIYFVSDFTSSNYGPLFLIVYLLIFAFILLMFKSRFEYFDYAHKYFQLLENTNKPSKSNIDLSNSDFLNKLKKNDFIIYRILDDFTIYFKFVNVEYKSKRTKTVVFLIKITGDILFNSKLIDEAINKFEDEHYKKEKFRNHIVLQFKEVDEFTSENIEETKKVSFSKPVKNHYVILINVLISAKDKKVYFLNADKLNPNHYYNFAVNEIKKII